MLYFACEAIFSASWIIVRTVKGKAFRRPETGCSDGLKYDCLYVALRNGLYQFVKRPLSACDIGCFRVQYGAFRGSEKPVPETETGFIVRCEVLF